MDVSIYATNFSGCNLLCTGDWISPKHRKRKSRNNKAQALPWETSFIRPFTIIIKLLHSFQHKTQQFNSINVWIVFHWKLEGIVPGQQEDDELNPVFKQICAITSITNLCISMQIYAKDFELKRQKAKHLT